MLIFLSILAFVWGYKKGKRTGRKPWLWSLICGFTFLGAQVLVSIVIASIVAIGVTLFGWNERLLGTLYYPIGIVALIAGVIALLVVFYYLDRAPRIQAFTRPPAPPKFGTDDQF